MLTTVSPLGALGLVGAACTVMLFRSSSGAARSGSSVGTNAHTGGSVVGEAVKLSQARFSAASVMHSDEAE